MDEPLHPPAPPLQWTLLSDHGHVLACLLTRPEVTIPEIVLRTGIDWRAAQRVLRQLERAGYVCHHNASVGSIYRLKPDLPRHQPFALQRELGELLALIACATPGSPSLRRATGWCSASAPARMRLGALNRHLVAARRERRTLTRTRRIAATRPR